MSVLFSERAGLLPTSPELDLTEITQRTRSRIWAAIYDGMRAQYNSRGAYGDYSYGTWETALRRIWVEVDYKYADQFPTLLTEYGRQFFKESPYNKFLDGLEIMVATVPLKEAGVNRIFSETGAPYTLEKGLFIPVGSVELADTVVAAIAGADDGASKHLRLASAALRELKYAESVKDSIHAVESAIRYYTNSATLKDGLRSSLFQAKHSALTLAIQKMYGYASDEEGVRHALVFEEEPNVSQSDALFMLGSCAAFVTYIRSLSRERDT